MLREQRGGGGKENGGSSSNTSAAVVKLSPYTPIVAPCALSHSFSVWLPLSPSQCQKKRNDAAVWRVANFREITCRGFRSLPFLPPLWILRYSFIFPCLEVVSCGSSPALTVRLRVGSGSAVGGGQQKSTRGRERERHANTLVHPRGREDRQAVTVARAAVFTSSAHPPLCISLCVTGLQAAESFSSFCPSVETWMYCWRIRSEQCIGLMQCSCVLTHSPPPRRVYCLSLSDAHTPIHSTSLPDSLFTVFFLLILWLLLSPLTPLSFYPHYFVSPSPLSKVSFHTVLWICSFQFFPHIFIANLFCSHFPYPSDIILPLTTFLYHMLVF